MIILSFHLNSTFFRENIRENIRKHIPGLKKTNSNTQNGGMGKKNKKKDVYMDLQHQWQYLVESLQEKDNIRELIEKIDKSMIEKKGEGYLTFIRWRSSSTGIYLEYKDNNPNFSTSTDINSEPDFHMSFHYGNNHNRQVNIQNTKIIKKSQMIGLCHITHKDKGDRIWEKTFPFYIYKDNPNKTLKIKMIQSTEDNTPLHIHYKNNIAVIFKDAIDKYLENNFTLVEREEIVEREKISPPRQSTPEVLPVKGISISSPFSVLGDDEDELDDQNNDDQDENVKKKGGKRKYKTKNYKPRKHKTRKHKTRKHKTRKHKTRKRRIIKHIKRKT